MSTPVATVGAAGISVPAFSDVLAWAQQQFQAIYGADVYLGNDSPDGQLVALLATAINDCNAVAVSVYNSFSPTTAQGAGLSSVVKVNGITRDVPSASTVPLNIVGQTGTTITNGVVTDPNGVRWDLPASVVIPASGTINVTATAETTGAITLATGVQMTISTPTRGWQSATTSASATAGQPVETDAALRQRQSISVAMPSQTLLAGIEGAIAAIPGVARYRVYENDTSVTDTNGIPSHTISAVVDGGDNVAIAQAIIAKKTIGTGTYGTTSQTLVDSYGVQQTINFYRPTSVPITVIIDIHALAGYTSVIGDEIVAAVVAAINAGSIGDNILYTRLYVPAQLIGPYAAPVSAIDATTFELVDVKIARTGTPAAADVVLAFNEAPSCTAASVTLNVS